MYSEDVVYPAMGPRLRRRPRLIMGCTQATFCIIVGVIVMIILVVVAITLGILLPRKSVCDCAYGECIGNVNGGLNCQCQQGYSGLKCDQATPICDAAFCLHGTCYVVSGVPSCTCNAGYAGARCEIMGTQCTSSTCVHGTCASGSSCTCNQGYGGSTCNIPIAQLCTPNPCLYGAHCVITGTTYTCQCPVGWTGTNCQTAVCSDNTCLFGTCIASQFGSARCDCSPNYAGQYCDIFVDQCLPDPCLSGQGTCQLARSPYGDDYVCLCNLGYSGRTCQDYACAVNTCVHGACVPVSEDTYTCSCEPGWTGDDCDEEKLCTHTVESTPTGTLFDHSDNGLVTGLTFAEWTDGSAVSFKGLQVDYTIVSSAWDGDYQTGAGWATYPHTLGVGEYITGVSGLTGTDPTSASTDDIITQLTFTTSGAIWGPHGGIPSGTATPFSFTGIRLKYVTGYELPSGIEQMSFTFVCA